MYKIELTNLERTALQDKIVQSTNPWLTKRYQTILMRADGLSNTQIVAYVCKDENTITNWVKLYKEGGIEKLSTLNLEGRHQSKLEEYADQISAYVDQTEVTSMKQLSNWLLQTHQVKVEESWLRRWCKKKVFL